MDSSAALLRLICELLNVDHLALGRKDWDAALAEIHSFRDRIANDARADEQMRRVRVEGKLSTEIHYSARLIALLNKIQSAITYDNDEDAEHSAYALPIEIAVAIRSELSQFMPQLNTPPAPPPNQ